MNGQTFKYVCMVGQLLDEIYCYAAEFIYNYSANKFNAFKLLTLRIKRMSNQENLKVAGKKTRSLEDEIIAQREKLKMLEKKQTELIRKEKEKTSKAVINLIQAEKLDLISLEKWKGSLPAIKELLAK